MEYPFVSLVTCVNNKISLEILFECYKLTDYPKNKIEWIIIDNSENKILEKINNNDTIKYFYFKNKMTKGMMYNIACNKTKYDIIMHFENDCYYLQNHIKTRLHNLKNCSTSDKIGTFCTYKMISLINNKSKKTMSNRKTFSECLVYKKDFWNKKKFNEKDNENISFNFLKKRCYLVDNNNGTNIVVLLINKNNNKELKKRIENSEENGWHFGKIKNELFLKICSL